jgi:hypothetical protein
MIVEGTVIEATLRPEDLVPAFFKELFQIDRERAEDIIHGDYFAISHHIAAGRELPVALMADAHELVDILADALDELAPEGMYFGAHPGDGSDFGFWRLEDEPNKVLIHVEGGVAEVISAPENITVEIVDIDNLAVGE